MPAITIPDLINAKLDVDHMGAVATSAALTATDRLGNTKSTLAGLIAGLNADVAITQTGLNKTAAQLAKTQAEAARDSLNTTGKIFSAAEGTSAGIAATTNGQQFAVVAADFLTIAIYRNNAGAALLLSSVYTKAFIDALGFDLTYGRSGYAFAWLDSLANFALGIRNDGAVIFGRGGDVAQRLDLLEAVNAAAVTISDLTYNRSGYAHAWTDSLGNLAGGFDIAGDFINKGINLRASVLSLLSSIASNSKFITPSGFFAPGDSLTAGAGGTAYTAQLATLLGKPVTNLGVGGQTAQNISARFGGTVALLTVTGNTIPASGAVTVTAQTVQLHNNQGPGAISGTLGGIPGTLNATPFDGNGLPTAVNFTRTTAGTATVIDSATPFLVDTSDNRQFGTAIFWHGRNNVGSPSFAADVKAALANDIAQLKTQDQRFVVMSVLNTSAEVSGSATHTAITQLNNELKALYPRNYIDVRALLVRSGTGTGQDATDAANDVIPTSLRSDSIHLNTAGYGVVAAAIFKFLTTKGWLA